jgi:hypothetical protein
MDDFIHETGEFATLADQPSSLAEDQGLRELSH